MLTLRHFHPSHLLSEPIQRLIRALVAISLANLCYLRIWDALLHDPERNYLAATPYNPVDYAAAIIGVGLLAAGLYFVIRVVWRSDRRWTRAIAMPARSRRFLITARFQPSLGGADVRGVCRTK